MSRRPWTLHALVFLAGCATSADAVDPAPRPQKQHAAAPEDDDEDEDDAPPAPAAPPPRPVEQVRRPVAAAEEPHRPMAAEEPRRPIAAAPPSTDPFGDVGFKEVNEKDWLANLREKIAQQEKVAPTDLRMSPGLLRALYVKSPPVTPPKAGRRALPRRHEIVVVDNQGRRVATFRPVTAKGSDEPPKDPRFLSEERLVYEVVAPPPVAPSAAPSKAAVGRSKGRAARDKKTKATREPPRAAQAPSTPPRLFVIQPIVPRARPIRCEGFHFTFSRGRDKLAFVAGSAEAGFVAVDGAQVYPRRGRTIVASAPVWSKDGRSLAFLESPPARAARLVLLAELDNPTGDTTWDLPPAAPLEGAGVFWAGTGKLVVGKTAMRPVFSASFFKEAPGAHN